MVMLGSNEVVVGQRVQAKADGHRATVRFVGSVDGASPEDGWVGVEWDSVGRGKHDGEAKGKRYFTCAPGQGSFVRPENVLAEPVSFQNALTRKYASEEAANAEINMSFREAEGKKAAVVVEFVGNDKEVERMKRTQDLEEVTLLGACISSAGDEKWISEKACGITGLELEDNLLANWETVSDITAHLRKLHTLSLSGNRLAPVIARPIEDSKMGGAFLSLGKLVLNATGVQFSDLEHMKGCFPNLTDMHLASCKISTIDCGGGGAAFEGWPSLELIDLSDNQISKWEGEIDRLDAFKGLTRLILNSNSIPSITIPAPSNDGARIQFQEVALLALAKNDVCAWESVDALGRLPNLREVRLQDNPLADELRPGAIRQVIIAKVPSARAVNGGEVRPRERVEAEKFYIRHCLETSGDKTAAEIASSDGAFAMCLEKHGEPVAKKEAALGGGGGGLIQVTLKSMAPESSHIAPVSRKLPGSMTVSSIKRMCQQLFGLDLGKQRLFCRAVGEKDVWESEAMSDDMKPINYYVTGEESEILMQEGTLAKGEDQGNAQKERQEAEEKELKRLEAMGMAQRNDVIAAKNAASASAQVL